MTISGAVADKIGRPSVTGSDEMDSRERDWSSDKSDNRYARARTQRPGTVRLRAGTRQKSGSGSPPMSDQIRSDSLADIVLFRWKILAAPSAAVAISAGRLLWGRTSSRTGRKRATRGKGSTRGNTGQEESIRGTLD